MRNSQISNGQRMAKWAALLAGLLLAGQAASLQAAVPAASAVVKSQASAGATVDVEGELQVLHEDDFKHKKSRERHFLTTDDGQRFELRFAHAPHALQSGSRLRVHGTQNGNLLELSSTGTSTQVVSQPNSVTIGEQKTAVLLVNFQGNPIQPYTQAQVNDVVFNSTSNFYKENSGNQTWFTGQVFGWYTMPIAFTCDTTQIAAAARQQAANAGVDLTPYARIIYWFPQNGACSWSGVGSVGGSNTEAWINGDLSVKVIGHELGHNLGLYHSHGLECGTATLGSSCTVVEYGDSSDIMGNLASVHFNGFQKQHLGWLNDGVATQIQTVTTSGSYTLDAYEQTSGSNFRTLRIPKGIDPTTGMQTWYYVEYRQPLGFDGVLPSLYNSNLTGGVQLRVGTDGDPNSSSLLDTTPGSSTADDMNDAALLPGRTYTDATAGVTITTSWANSSNAGVSITFSQQSCVRKAPAVSLSTSQTGSVAAGTAVSYTVAVSNQDSSACTASSFNLASVLPSGWSASFASSSLSIAAGSVGSTTVKVTSATAATAGSYGFTVNASDAAGTGSASGSYSVAASTLSDSVVTDKSSYLTGATVTITTSVLNNGAIASGVPVALKITKANGSVLNQSLTTDSTGKAVYKLRLAKQDPIGQYQVGSTASSGGKTAATTTAFSVTK